ncbi:MAG: OsmC family protein [Planctomycetaceae bacterium]|nr:OsmC family protein [Planctomycetaceae bacterium]
MESARRVEAVYDAFQHCTARQLDGKKSVVMYAPASCGGSSSGEEFAPDELVAAGLAGCTLLSMQIGLLAQQREVDLLGSSVKATVRMACGSSQRVAGVDIEVQLPHALSAEDRRAVEEAAEGCPLTASFHPDIPISLNFKYPES